MSGNFDLKAYAGRAGIADVENFLAQCNRLYRLLLAGNAVMNLTNITARPDYDLKHIADSLSIAVEFPELAQKSLQLADIGCGAGFPSLVLALAFPQLQVTAIDSIGKKINFVRETAQALGLTNLTAVNGRAVELNRKPEFQKKYDVVTARAVAPTAKLYRETANFPVNGGRWIFYKTPGQAGTELPELTAASKKSWHVSESFTLTEETGPRLFIFAER